jgi:hypothetical protein
VRLGQMKLSDGTPVRIVQGDERHAQRGGQSTGTSSRTP